MRTKVTNLCLMLALLIPCAISHSQESAEGDPDRAEEREVRGRRPLGNQAVESRDVAQDRQNRDLEARRQAVTTAEEQSRTQALARKRWEEEVSRIGRGDRSQEIEPMAVDLQRQANQPMYYSERQWELLKRTGENQGYPAGFAQANTEPYSPALPSNLSQSNRFSASRFPSRMDPELAKANQEANTAINDLVKQIESAKDDTEKDKLKAQISTLLGAQYDAYLTVHEKPLKQLEERLAKLREEFESRKKAKDDLVKLRLDTIWYKAIGLNWPGNDRSGSSFFSTRDNLQRNGNGVTGWSLPAIVPPSSNRDSLYYPPTQPASIPPSPRRVPGLGTLEAPPIATAQPVVPKPPQPKSDR